MYILNRVGDIGQPRNKPFVLQNSSEKFDLIFSLHLLLINVQGGSNMTGTDLCVNVEE
jgi:hypothetical protein